jgi:hypothetical protein
MVGNHFVVLTIALGCDPYMGTSLPALDVT